MTDYAKAVTAIAQRFQTQQEQISLRNAECRPRFLYHPEPTPKVCLFFHGFTAGPYQYAPLGQLLFESGYNVVVPLQPGHGLAGGWDRKNPPPLPTDIQTYQEFAEYWFRQVQPLGQEVVIGGLSSGALMAAWLALEHPQTVDRALLFAPFLSGSNFVVDWIVRHLSFYFEWLNKDNPGNHGYDGFRLPALRLFLEWGDELSERIKTDPIAPICVIASEGDRATKQSTQKALFEDAVRQQPKSWFHCFDKAFDMPHVMMTKAEGNDYVKLLYSLAKAFIESDLTWAEVQAIAVGLRQGEPFDAIVTQLGLTHRISADLSIIRPLLARK